MEAKKNFLYLFHNRLNTQHYSPHDKEAEEEMTVIFIVSTAESKLRDNKLASSELISELIDQ